MLNNISEFLKNEAYRISIIPEGVHILNYKNIIDISSDKVLISFKDKSVNIKGSNLRLIKLAIESPSNKNKYIMGGIIGMLIYQQFQNIGMTLGIMPITGITLPFISYGGSSLLSYMIIMGIILNISNENIRYRN